MMKKRVKRAFKIIAGYLIISMLGALLLPGAGRQTCALSEQSLSLKEAQRLALSNSKAYQKTQTKISLQKAKYAESVKSIALKKKNMETFRWSPLLSFTLPEKPDLKDAYDWEYKPVQLQCELNSLAHELTDLKYETTEQISNLYVQAYVCQEKLVFAQRQKEESKRMLDKKQILLKTGEASQAEADKLKQSVKKLDSDISLRKRNLAALEEKMSDMLKLDVTAGYHFENPMTALEVKRSALDALTKYTLENDQGYYEAKMNTRLGLISLEQNDRLMSQQYGSKMNVIRSYISQAEKGQAVDADAFKQAYDSFLNQIDKPWTGKLRILFIKIPKDWYKGSLDGARYVEDDPYALYTAALKYSDLKNEEKSVCSALKMKVSDSFEAIVTAMNAYKVMEEETGKQGKTIEKGEISNRLGEKGAKELKEEQDSYEAQQMDALDALASVNGLLYSFDRLTCGGVTLYQHGKLPGARSGEEGADPAEENDGGAAYYIQSEFEDSLFLLGIVIPDGFTPHVDSFELWVNDTQIGERTAADSEIKHLKLTLDGIDTAELRLYDGDAYIGRCGIDPMAKGGGLKVLKPVGQ